MSRKRRSEQPEVTPSQLARAALERARQRELVLERARNDFTAFKKFIHPSYEQAPHLDYIDAALMRLEASYRAKKFEGIKPNLMIELPPRHGKSLTVARLFPAWFLGRNPSARIILACYGASLAEKHSRFIRMLIRSKRFHELFPEVYLSEDSQARDAWDIANFGGGLDAVGKGGALTGKGADLIITDDLVKGRLEAESLIMREQDWSWLQDDLLTRKNSPYALHVAIGTRWHQDDVHGRIHEQERDLWDFITFPAIAEEADVLGRKPGEALWEARFPLAELQKTRRRMGEYSFEALYQQKPFLRTGSLFKVERLVPIENVPLQRLRVIVRFWDLAMSSNAQSDYTVGVLMGMWNEQPVILDMIRAQLEWSSVTNLIVQTALTDGPRVRIGIESSFFHSQAVKELLRKPSLRGFSVQGVQVEGDKYIRALPFAARVNEGLCYIVRGNWNHDLIEEMRAFPSGRHDDIVDALSGAYNLLVSSYPILVHKQNLVS